MPPWVEQRFLAIALLMLANPCACEAPVCNNDARCETSAAHNDFPDDASIDGMHMSLLQESLRVASSEGHIALQAHSGDGQDGSLKKQAKKSDASKGKEETHSPRRRKEKNKKKTKSKDKEKDKDASKGKEKSAVAPAIRMTLGNKKKSTYELSWVGLGWSLVILGILFGLLFVCLCGACCTAGAGWCKSGVFWCFPSRVYEEHLPAKWETQQVRTVAAPPTMQPVRLSGEQANWDMQTVDGGRRTLGSRGAARSSSPMLLSSGQLRGGYPGGTQGLGVDVGFAPPGGGAQQLLGGSQSTRPFVGSF